MYVILSLKSTKHLPNASLAVIYPDGRPVAFDANVDERDNRAFTLII
jgi:hypothetical protein